jgi:acetyl esterase/lipase
MGKLRPKQFMPALHNLIAAIDWHAVLGNSILYVSGGFVAFLSRYSHNPFLPLYVIAWYASELPQVILLLQTVSVAAAFKLTGGFHDYISQIGVLWHAGSAAYSIAHVLNQTKAAPAFKRVLMSAGMGQPRSTPTWIRALFWFFPVALTMKYYGRLQIESDIQYQDGPSSSGKSSWWGSRDTAIPQDEGDPEKPTGARFRWYPEGNRPSWMTNFRGITHLIRGFGSKGWKHLDIIYQKDEDGSAKKKAPKPVMLYIHGGGWATCDKWMSMLPVIYRVASEGIVVVSVNYRLAPEYKFPTMLHDAKRAIVWAKKHIAEYGGDPNCIIIGGESAGGHLSSLCALSQNDKSRQPGFEDEDTSVQVCGARSVVLPSFPIACLLTGHRTFSGWPSHAGCLRAACGLRAGCLPRTFKYQFLTRVSFSFEGLHRYVWATRLYRQGRILSRAVPPATATWHEIPAHAGKNNRE